MWGVPALVSLQVSCSARRSLVDSRGRTPSCQVSGRTAWRTQWKSDPKPQNTGILVFTIGYLGE